MSQEHENLNPNSLAARDHEEEQATYDLEDLYERASKASGRPINQMIKEAKQNHKWPGKMNLLDYVLHGLYNLDKKQRKEFLSDWLHWPIHEFCKDEVWSEKTVDKWVCTNELEQAGIPTIPVLAVVDTTGAEYGDTPTIATTEQLDDFFASATFPLFAKPNRLLGSFGAMRIDERDGDDLIVNGEREPLDSMITELMADVPYVVQHAVANHDDIAEFADALATLRTVNMVENGSVRLERAVLKIPSAGNVADNLWRAGNMVANVDPTTGVIDRVIKGKGPDLVELTEHPDTGTRLLGMQLPMWDQVVELNDRAASLFGAISYQSLDVGFTNDGPVVVEVNSGGSFSLPQQASGVGLLTAENKKFFESQGVNFRKLEDTPL